MTRDEAIAIIRKEYLCVDRDCGIEKNCGKCDLVLPSKEPILEAFKMAIKALEQEPCEDAISRQGAIDALHARFGVDFDWNKWWSSTHVLAAIESVPAVETQEPKTGHWVTKPNVYGVAYCSECDFKLKIDDTNFCPNCGAKMVEPEESEG